MPPCASLLLAIILTRRDAPSAGRGSGAGGLWISAWSGGLVTVNANGSEHRDFVRAVLAGRGISARITAQDTSLLREPTTLAILNLSMGGACCEGDPLGLSEGSTVEVEVAEASPFYHGAAQVARVWRHGRQGLALKFFATESEQGQGLASFLASSICDNQ